LLPQSVFIERPLFQKLLGHCTSGLDIPDQILPVSLLSRRYAAVPAILLSQLSEVMSLPLDSELMRLFVQTEPPSHVRRSISKHVLTESVDEHMRRRMYQRRVCPGVVHPLLNRQLKRDIRLDTEDCPEVETVDVMPDDPPSLQDLFAKFFKAGGQHNVTVTPCIPDQTNKFLRGHRVKKFSGMCFNVEYQGALGHDFS